MEDGRAQEMFTANWVWRPTTKEVPEISVQLDLEQEVVQIWFCNRRQKDRQQKQALDRRQNGSDYYVRCEI